jgi:hypothetical protein
VTRGARWVLPPRVTLTVKAETKPTKFVHLTLFTLDHVYKHKFRHNDFFKNNYITKEIALYNLYKLDYNWLNLYT